MHSSERKKIYWITGASSGIGKVIAEQLATAGHKVLVSSRSEEALHNLAANFPDNVIPVPCDIRDDQQMASLFTSSFTTVEYIDCAILCAGICEYIDYPNLDIASIRKVMDTNYIGSVNSCIAALPLLQKAKQHSSHKGHIVAISSMSCYIGFPRAEAYGSSKAALSYFMNSLRVDLNKSLDVSIVYPGFVETPMTKANDFPMPFQVSASKAASVVIKKLAKRPNTIVFPRRLHYVLSIAAMFSGIWYSTIASRLSRNRDEAL